MAKQLNRILFYLFLVGIWYIVAAGRIWPDYLFPSPVAVFRSMSEGFLNGTFFIGILASLKRIAIGYGISTIAGVILGLWIGRNSFVEQTLGTLVLGLQTLPSICWLPLAILWFGLNETAIIFVIIMGALLAITLATESGVKNIPPIFIKAGRNMGATELRLLIFVIIPAAFPAIISGLKQGWAFAWRSLMAGELLYVSAGLGQLLMMGRELNDMNRVVAVMLILIGIGLVFDRIIFAKLEKTVQHKWGLEK